MSNESLMDEVLSGLARDRRPAPLREIASRADVNYEWLVKLANGHFSDAGVRKVERVKTVLDDFSQ